MTPISSSGPQPENPLAKMTPEQKTKLQEQFREFVGGTFYRQLFKAMRSSTGKAAYFNGGQTEKIFQQQLDELLIKQMSDARGGTFSDELFEQQFERKRFAPPTSPRTPDPAKSTFDVDV